MIKHKTSLILLLFVLCSFPAYYMFDKQVCIAWLHNIAHYHNAYGLLLLSIIYILSNLFLLPLGLPITLLAGMIWGTLIGGILINVLATSVAVMGFYIGRWFANGFLDDHQRFQWLTKINTVVCRYDWQFIFLARINPIVPFGLSNYLFGMMPDLSFKQYFIVTLVANLIPCLAFAAIGEVLNTFTIEGTPIYTLIFKIGCMLSLFSLLFFMKVAAIKRLRA